MFPSQALAIGQPGAPQSRYVIALDIMLGDDGKIWLIDFGLSGFYPEWFEYVAMFEWENLGWLGRLARCIIAGFHHKRAQFIDYISWALDVGYMM